MKMSLKKNIISELITYILLLQDLKLSRDHVILESSIYGTLFLLNLWKPLLKGCSKLNYDLLFQTACCWQPYMGLSSSLKNSILLLFWKHELKSNQNIIISQCYKHSPCYIAHHIVWRSHLKQWPKFGNFPICPPVYQSYQLI